MNLGLLGLVLGSTLGTFVHSFTYFMITHSINWKDVVHSAKEKLRDGSSCDIVYERVENVDSNEKFDMEMVDLEGS